MSDKPKWQTYEEVAQHLLNEFAAHFDLGRVEGKQVVPGESGTEWEIDAKGVTVSGEAFVIVECRRHTTSKLRQENVAGLAYRIEDTGASIGILVTPLDLQGGAEKVAAHANIQHVILDPNSTTTEYVMRFLNCIVTGDVETYSGPREDGYTDEIIQDGKVIEKRHYE